MPKKKPGTGEKPRVAARERYPSGDPKPEAKDEPIAPTLLKRLKDTILPQAKDKRLGTVLGTMHLQAILTEAEAEAGMKYAEDVGAYERSMGHPRRNVRSPSYDEGFKGSVDVDFDHLRRMDPVEADKREKQIRRRRKAIQKRYDRAQACIPDFPSIAAEIIDEVCCNDRPVSPVFHQGLKQILGNLAVNCYRLSNADQGARRPRTSRKADAALMAQGTVDAMEEWFRRRQCVVTGFRRSVPNRVQAPSFTVFGVVAHDGKPIQHTIHLKRSGLMSEEINFHLLTAAEAKGWREHNPKEPPKPMTEAELRAAVEKLRRRA